MIYYFALAAWFFLIDMLAGELAGSRPRPMAGMVLALLWPISIALALCAAAIIIRRLKESQP